MFSPTTIASSTTIPRTKIKANNEIMFILVSKIGINIMPPAKLIGIPIIIQNAKSILKNIASVINTKSSPSQRFFINRSILSCKTRERSLTISNLIEDGN